MLVADSHYCTNGVIAIPFAYFRIHICKVGSAMDRKIKVAVMGATGAVGQVFMWMLSDHPWFELAYCTADIEVKEFDFDAMEEAGVQIVFSALPAAVAAEAEPQLRARGFYVFSNAAAMRYESNVPILIPETNVEQLDLIRSQGFPNSGFVVTNANCVTTGLAMALAPLRKFGIRTITINSYHPVSRRSTSPTTASRSSRARRRRSRRRSRRSSRSTPRSMHTP